MSIWGECEMNAMSQALSDIMECRPHEMILILIFVGSWFRGSMIKAAIVGRKSGSSK